MSAYSLPTTLIKDLGAAAPPELAALQNLRVAVVHEWLTSYAGSERVLEQILEIFPNADLFALVDHLPPTQRGFLKGRPVRTSFMQKIPFSRKVFRGLLWLLPAAIESFDLAGYDIVISSSHAVAKGVLTGPDQLHICYCHSPIRYAWDLQHEYLRQSGLDKGLRSIYAKLVLHYLRIWDTRTANGVDQFVANSNFVARRISKVYNRNATVVHPPVDVDSFALECDKEEFYFTASRMVPYKRVDLIVAAFAQMPNRKLIVAGEGPGLAQCKFLATPNIQFLPHQSAESLALLMSKAKAFVFAAEEDFGITIVEAQACGTPVIAYGRGGALDSILEDETGVFFRHQNPDSIIASVERFESGTISLRPPSQVRAHALQFSPAHFRTQMSGAVDKSWKQFNGTAASPGFNSYKPKYNTTSV